MLYLGIDQHSKQITVAVLDSTGNVMTRRQVSTRPEKTKAFLEKLRQQGPYLAIVEVCGFNDWLIKMLVECGCQEVILIHPERYAAGWANWRCLPSIASNWINHGLNGSCSMSNCSRSIKSSSSVCHGLPVTRRPRCCVTCRKPPI